MRYLRKRRDEGVTGPMARTVYACDHCGEEVGGESDACPVCGGYVVRVDSVLVAFIEGVETGLAIGGKGPSRSVAQERGVTVSMATDAEVVEELEAQVAALLGVPPVLMGADRSIKDPMLAFLIREATHGVTPHDRLRAEHLVREYLAFGGD